MNVIHDFADVKSPGLLSKHVSDTDWWRGAVIYQIYPRSFQDTNGDGIGDIRGITNRLPYIADLGVDAIWISPFFKSPMLDFGYDVSDYREVDPMFGTLADFDAMITEAHRLGLKVMIDQVLSHTSDQHEWFKQSRSSKTNRMSDWYVWADAKPDGTPPNNWLSIFGGSAWKWDTNRCQYFLHNFLDSQPDLNFHNPLVQDQLIEEVRFWLDRGVDGFRLDTINFYVHSEGLEDNPALGVDERSSSIAPAVNPYNHQDHIYDKSRPENIAFLVKFRKLLDEYDAVAVGEVGDAQRGLELVSQYTSGDDKMQMCYSFDFLEQTQLTAERVRTVVEEFERVAADGWSCWAFSNHDVQRHASRWADLVEDRLGFLKMTTSIILTLRGSVCLYQGEELGLTEAMLNLEDLVDPYGIEFWPTFKGRDGCRTPMVWTDDNSYAGFSTAKPWLPVPPEHLHLSVDTQEQDEDSLLHHYRAVLNFRGQHLELSKGSIKFLDTVDGVLMFERTLDKSTLLIAINTNGEDTEAAFDGEKYSAIAPNLSTGLAEDDALKLPPYGLWIGKNSA